MRSLNAGREPTMQCPECRTEMDARQTRTGVELDVCGHCRSIWFDRGEILFFVRRPNDFSRAISEARTRAMESKFAGPGHGRPMLAIKTPGSGGPACLDPASGGVWLRGSTVRALYESGEMVIEPARGGGASSRSTGRRLPRLWPRTVLTLAGFYGLLSLVLITLSLFYGLAPGWALAMAAVVVGVQFLIGPFVMDLTMRWLYGVAWVEPGELPDHLRQFVARVCGEHGMKHPRMGVIPDQSPNAFTYGHTPNNARVVITQGLFELLEPVELEGVVAHELGHARHWDMALMTLVQLVPLILFYVYRTLIALDPDDSRAKSATTGAAIGAYLLYVVSEYFVLWFSRTREYHADRFGGIATGSPAGLARALVKIAYGLAGRGGEEEEDDAGGRKRARSGAASLGALGIFDAGAAQTLALTSHGAAHDADDAPAEEVPGRGPDTPRYRLDPEGVKGAMRWDLWNPWAKWYELHSTHPLVARRLLALSDLSMELGEDPFVRFDLQQPESFWDEFLVDVFVKLLPLLTLLGGAGAMVHLASVAPEMAAGALPWVILATGIAMMAKLRFRYPTRDFPDMSVATLLKQVKVSAMRPVPCRLEGRIRGRGVPGLIWSDDFVMQDDTGILFLDHRQPLAIWEWLFGWLRARNLIGEHVVVEGWYRRAPVPFVEIARYTVGEKTRRAWFRHGQWLIAWAVVAFGALLALAGYAPAA